MAFIRAHIPRLVFSTALLLSLAQPLFAHKEYVHQYLAIEAFKLLLDRYPALATSEFAAHIGAQGGSCDGFQFSLGTITGGAYREDCEDPVYHYGDVVAPLDNAYFSASHFWNADWGDNSMIRICDLTCGDYQNAYQKSLRYVLPGIYGRWTAKLTWPAGYASFYLQSGGTRTIYESGLIGFEYDSLTQFYRDGRCTITGYMDINGKWQTSTTVPDQLPLRIIAPKNVRDRIAWEVIGRIAHLLGDMGVPAHAHNDIHPPFWWNNEPADIFEEEMAGLYTAWDHRDAVGQGHLLEVPAGPEGILAEHAMHYLFYTTNQVADRFPSNDADGDALYDIQWKGDDYSVLDIIGEISVDPSARDAFHREAGDYAFVFSIRSIAGLFRWFALESGILGTVTVDADFPGATILVDGKPHAAPAAFTYATGTPFTLRAEDQETADPAGNGTRTMRFIEWVRSVPPSGETRSADRLLYEYTADGARYTAVFGMEVTLRLDPPRHMDGGDGGRYVVDGSDAGSAWTGPVNLGTTPVVTVACIPPAGSVFLRWSDDVPDNPREVSPEGNLTLHALLKAHLSTTSAPAGRPPNQRRIALTGSDGGGVISTVVAYESAGDVYFTESAGGAAWKDEYLVSDGLGNARDPSVGYFDDPTGEGAGVIVVWEDRGAGSDAYRILARVRQRPAEEWTGIRVVHAGPVAGDHRATPVVSGDLVVWKGPAGLLGQSLSGHATFEVPGTDGTSEYPLLDYYSYTGGTFALGWVRSGRDILFRRGTLPGPSWSALRVASAGPADNGIHNPDLAMNSGGSGCLAWAAPAGAEWSVLYTVVDGADSFQEMKAVSPCPLPGPAAPVVRLTHHRFDQTSSRDFGLHAWVPSTGVLSSFVLRSGGRVGQSAAPIPGTYPDLPREEMSSAGGTPTLVTNPGNGSTWTIAVPGLDLAPALPMPAALNSPPSGSAGMGASVALTWACSPDADSYTLQVGHNPLLAPPLLIDRGALTGGSFTLTDLGPGTVYYWRVGAVNTLGGGEYSETRSFSTSTLPPAPVLTGGIVSGGSVLYPRLSWTDPSGAATFRLFRYSCSDQENCRWAAARPALVYEGQAKTFTDRNIAVKMKSVSSRVNYYVTGEVNGFTSAASNTVSFGTEGNLIRAESAEDVPPPATSGLGANFPNPFNPRTTVPYRVASPGFVSVSVFNIIGQRVALLFEGHREPGYYQAVWEAAGAPAGVYFLEMEAPDPDDGRGRVDRRKILLLK